jgi:tagatose-1,6-bisphosphate aldolase non-catalytic subunit AgaZ/GatZ
MTPLLDLVHSHKSGESVGIYSVCSSRPLVLEAALRLAERCGSYALIEVTPNQVNQEDGYTGMRPAVFFESVHRLAAYVGLPAERVLLGGNVLTSMPCIDPQCWCAITLKRASSIQAHRRAFALRASELLAKLTSIGIPQTAFCGVAHSKRGET